MKIGVHLKLHTELERINHKIVQLIEICRATINLID